MPKAKRKSHACRTHDECRQWVCFLCLRKSDGNGISKSMEDFIMKEGIFSDFRLHAPFLPAGSCASCRTYVSRFWRDGTPVKSLSSNDYMSIANELRNLPLETRNPASKLECSCQICLISRSKITFSKKPKIVEASQLVKGVETPDKCPICHSPTGPGHKHSPKSCQSSKTLLDNLEKQLPPQVQEQFAARILNKVEKNSAGQVVLHTAGKPKLVSEGQVVEPVQISHNTFLEIERWAISAITPYRYCRLV